MDNETKTILVQSEETYWKLASVGFASGDRAKVFFEESDRIQICRVIFSPSMLGELGWSGFKALSTITEKLWSPDSPHQAVYLNGKLQQGGEMFMITAVLHGSDDPQFFLPYIQDVLKTHTRVKRLESN